MIKVKNMIKVLLFLTVIVAGCNSHNDYPKVCDQTIELIIINKTNNNYLADTSIIRDEKAINELCSLLTQLVPLTRYPKLKVNFGYFELHLLDQNRKDYGIDIFYTVYDGVIIRYSDGKFYKQDNLLEYVLHYTNEK